MNHERCRLNHSRPCTNEGVMNLDDGRRIVYHRLGRPQGTLADDGAKLGLQGCALVLGGFNVC